MTASSAAKRKYRIFIVEDHVMVREGFVALVDREKDLVVCGQADRISEALPSIEQTAPDLVVIDLILRDGDGLELIKSLRSQYPGLPMLVVSMQDEEIYAERVLRAGAKGYLMKYCATSDLLLAIRRILGGDVYISAKMNARILRTFTGSRAPAPDNQLDCLTDREIEIYQRLGSGMSSHDIAGQLGISTKTVETHREHIKDKLHLKNATELVQAATRWVEAKERKALDRKS